ncbi:hypothetical protein BH23CHL2_BH23CHL2_07810 [soil metagenome]
MDPGTLRAIYLSGEKVYIRAYVEDDKHHAAAWADSPFPVGSPRGEKLLKEWHTEYWPRTRRYALCRSENDEIVGGVTTGIRNLVGEFKVVIAPWIEDADELRADAFKLIVPWLSEEWTLVSVTAHVASDQPATRASAEQLGMSHQATMREFFARPNGVRADDLLYQKYGTMKAATDA